MSNPLTKFFNEDIAEASFKDFFREEGAVFPRERAIIRRQAAVRNQDMDMRMEIEPGTKGMHNRSNAGNKSLFIRPREQSISGGREEEFEGFTVCGEKSSTTRQEERRRCGDRKS